ncbi:MAG: hypothetical protein WAL59_01290 [Roseiarcus sp.]
MVAREPIVTVDEASRRLVWAAEGRATHYMLGPGILAGRPNGALI